MITQLSILLLKFLEIEGIGITIELIILAFVAIFILSILAASIKIIPEYQRLLIFRLGRAIGVKGPGLVFLIPLIDKGDKLV